MSGQSILDVKPRDAFEAFLHECAAVGLDADRIRTVAVATMAYLRSTSVGRRPLQSAQRLEQGWYASLARGKPDWKVYASDSYLSELWACWSVYSRPYLRSVRSPSSLPSVGGVVKDLGRVRNVVDLGCGFGYTTAALRQMFPSAKVFGTNIEGTVQTTLAQRLGKRYGFQVGLPANDQAADLVFASEYFEHFESPIGHLRYVLSTYRPRALLVANAFGTRAIGHFHRYKVAGAMLDGKATSRRFHLELRQRGFKKVRTALWNNRPAYWKLVT